ncbi:DUF2490 domain-containing protein [Flavihumibacter profundi]|jgi:hypothetical protein|uniref:DUF2490 domain-containing protein n=1 Tax=Flavihumibacter profundi TaxID=2716883 RepID=UPI001CC4766D|nr:DUF2490 domain-containing protein [Flavihumibacter profundi]MBZ5856304.1 DUF2490 domain-containing protein [Flavihumibacter profundi]
MKIETLVNTNIVTAAGAKRHLQLFVLFLALSVFLIGNKAYSQIPRVTESNTIAWFQLNTELQFNKKWGLHIDLNSRRVDFVQDNMQTLFRTGLNFRPSEKILLRAGIANAHNTPYGTYPINKYGKPFDEIRLFQMVGLADKIGPVELNHRFMLEQRWLEKYSKPELDKPDGYTYLNRLRYLLRLQMPFKKNAKQQKYPYLTMYDEVMICFGNEVNANIFDQNRFAILAGFRFNSVARIEAGYLNQILQLPRRVDNNNVIQYNNGLQVNLLLTISTKNSK